MSAEATHTPLPWGIEQTNRRNWIGPMRTDGAKVSEIVTSTDREGLIDSSKDRNDANAALIVRAVNCHHEMLEALKTIASYPVARGYPDGPCIESEDMKEIKAIIAKAEEAQPLSTHQAV